MDSCPPLHVHVPRLAHLAHLAHIARLGAAFASLASVACAGAGGELAQSPDPVAHQGASGPSFVDSNAGAAAAPPANNTPGSPGPTRVWEPAKSLSTLRKATQRARSQHVHGDLEGEVLTNAEASAYPSLGPARTVAAGAVLVEAHYKPGSSDLVILFVMEKKPPGFDPEGGDWEYLVVEPSGVIRHQAHATLCARCHAEAPNDHLFGVAH